LKATLGEEKEWVHNRPPLLAQGRVRKYPPPSEGGEEEESEESGKKKKAGTGEEEADAEADLGVKLNVKKGIEEDARLNGEMASFSFRVDDVLPDSPLLISSNYWPGAYTVAYAGQRRVRLSRCVGRLDASCCV
jgi:hypothetical protein